MKVHFWMHNHTGVIRQNTDSVVFTKLNLNKFKFPERFNVCLMIAQNPIYSRHIQMCVSTTWSTFPAKMSPFPQHKNHIDLLWGMPQYSVKGKISWSYFTSPVWTASAAGWIIGLRVPSLITPWVNYLCHPCHDNEWLNYDLRIDFLVIQQCFILWALWQTGTYNRMLFLAKGDMRGYVNGIMPWLLATTCYSMWYA